MNRFVKPLFLKMKGTHNDRASNLEFRHTCGYGSQLLDLANNKLIVDNHDKERPTFDDIIIASCNGCHSCDATPFEDKGI